MMCVVCSTALQHVRQQFEKDNKGARMREREREKESSNFEQQVLPQIQSSGMQVMCVFQGTLGDAQVFRQRLGVRVENTVWCERLLDNRQWQKGLCMYGKVSKQLSRDSTRRCTNPRLLSRLHTHCNGNREYVINNTAQERRTHRNTSFTTNALPTLESMNCTASHS